MFDLNSWHNIWENRASLSEDLSPITSPSQLSPDLVSSILTINGFDDPHNQIGPTSYLQYISSVADYVSKSSSPYGALLELGCGTGLTLFLLAHSLGITSPNISGVDYSQHMLSIGSRLFPDISFLHQQLNDYIPSMSSTNRLVFANSVCQYLSLDTLEYIINSSLNNGDSLLFLDVPDLEMRVQHQDWKASFGNPSKPSLHTYYSRDFFLKFTSNSSISVTLSPQFPLFGPQSKYRFNVFLQP